MAKPKERGPTPSISRLAVRANALSHPVRANLMAHLARNGPTSVGELQRAVGASTSGVSQHLKLLKADGAVTSTRDAQTVRYDVTPGWVSQLIADLEGIRMGGDKQAEPGKAVKAEATGKKVAEKVEPVKAEKRNPILLGTAEITPIPKPTTTKKKRKRAIVGTQDHDASTARPDGPVSHEEGEGIPETVYDRSESQDTRPDAEITGRGEWDTVDDAIPADDFAPEADEVYPTEAAGTVYAPPAGGAR